MSSDAAAPRQTRQRAAVHAALSGRTDFLSAQQLHDVLRREGASVGLTTVYRTLQALADAGELDAILTDDGETVYRRCSPDHHHHLVCRRCGRTVEIAGPAVEEWSESVAREHGFTDVSHTVEVFGVCSSCGSG